MLLVYQEVQCLYKLLALGKQVMQLSMAYQHHTLNPRISLQVMASHIPAMEQNKEKQFHHRQTQFGHAYPLHSFLGCLPREHQYLCEPIRKFQVSPSTLQIKD